MPWSFTRTCVSSAPGAAALTNLWPDPSSAVETSRQHSGPPAPENILSTTVVTKPTVSAQGIVIMWESTDTGVQSWFESVRASTGSRPTNPTASGTTTTPAPTLQTAMTAPSTQNHAVVSTRRTGAGGAGLLLVVLLGFACALSGIVLF